MSSSVFLIAEIGSSHDGSLDRAKRLIDVAMEAGCSAAKVQFWSDASRLAARRHAPELEPVYRRYQIPAFWLDELARYCGNRIEFMATVYLPGDLPLVAPHVRRWKIASFEATDRAFLLAHLPYDKPLVISTGMMTAADVRELDEWLMDYDDLPPEVYCDTALLHCTSAYPCPLDQANLGAIRWLKEWWVGPVGLSDHTAYEWTGALAVAAGAAVIEIHVRLDDTDPANSDYPHSLMPEQLRAYVEHVRLAERMMGSGKKAPQPAEAAMMRYRTGGDTP